MRVLPFNPFRGAISRSCGLSIALLVSAASAADFHHVHLNVTDPPAAVKWYLKNLGGEPVSAEGAAAVAFGKTSIEFAKVPDKSAPSDTSSIDHVGFAYPDITAKMQELARSDVEIVSAIQQEGPIKYAFIRDPWGTLLEVVEDRDVSGFHHIHLASPDPRAALAWYKDQFGGEAGRYARLLPGVRYGEAWILAKRVAAPRAATKGRSIDHVCWSAADPVSMAEGFRRKGIVVEQLRSAAEQEEIFVTSPEGARIELIGRAP